MLTRFVDSQCVQSICLLYDLGGRSPTLCFTFPHRLDIPVDRHQSSFQSKLLLFCVEPLQTHGVSVRWFIDFSVRSHNNFFWVEILVICCGIQAVGVDYIAILMLIFFTGRFSFV